MKITAAEWLAEVERLTRQQRPNDPGFTTEEWAREMGVCYRTARMRLRAIQARLIRGTKCVEGLNGRVQPVSCYRLAPAKAATRRR